MFYENFFFYFTPFKKFEFLFQEIHIGLTNIKKSFGSIPHTNSKYLPFGNIA